MGDFNAHIEILSEPVNRNRELLLNFAEEMGASIYNWYVEPTSTWTARGLHLTIDFISKNIKESEDGS